MNINTKWKIIKDTLRKKLLKDPEHVKKLKKEKFVSFFRQSILPKELIEKYPHLIANTKKEYLTGKFRYTLTPHNRIVIKIIMRGFFLIYITLFSKYWDSDIVTCKPQIHDFTIFNYFNNVYFFKYYCNNKLLQIIVKSSNLDFYYYDTFINYFNFYIFWHLDIFNVILNFEDYKYEEDLYWLAANPNMLLFKNKRDKKKANRMKTDFFYYIKRKNRFRVFNKYIKYWPWYRDAPWNQIEEGVDDEISIKIKQDKKNLKDHLNLQDNLFFCYIIYEFALILMSNFTFNFFNVDFFNKSKLFINKQKKKIKKYPFFLKSTYYNYNIDLLKKWTRRKLPLYTEYKNINKKYNKKLFDTNTHILDAKYFGIKIPFLIFLLYTWYSIYFRRLKYNFYIRSEIFFQEHFSKLHYFVWANNAAKAGINKYKLSQYKYQKLFTIYHLKTYLEVEWFNNWFFFYMSYHIKFKKYINLNEYRHKSTYLLLLKDPYIIKLLNVNIIKNVKNIYMEILFSFFHKWHYWYELYNGYVLFMKAAVTKFEKDFRFGLLNYLKYDKMIEKIYLVPFDKKFLLRYLEIKILFENYFNIYLNHYSNFYFLTDLYNWKAIKEYNKNIKIVNFFDKIFYVIFFVVDPYFFKYYWKRCFPRKWHKLAQVMHYLLANIIMIQRGLTAYNLHLNVPRFHVLMYFFLWRIESSNYFIVNDYKSIFIGYDFIAINLIYKTRFMELVKQINFLTKRNHKYSKNTNDKNAFINVKFFFSYYLSILKSYYFSLLHQNIEYLLLLFFFNKKKYINILYTYKHNFFKDFLYSNFIYRYYIYSIVIETHYYKDWFHDWNKRIYWIYKNFLQHEGTLFYDKKTFII